MPTIPICEKMYFCRVTTPQISIPNNLFIKTKFYHHPFTSFFYVHETGTKTEKPHYHIIIICKSTKIEITKWIKENFKVTGNQQFSVSDKYKPESLTESLTYMYKGGVNEINGSRTLDSETLEELKTNYKNILKTKKNIIDEKFEHYYQLIEKELKSRYNHYNFKGVNEFLSNLETKALFKIIYDILIKNAISRRILFRKNIIAEHAFVYSCHFANNTQLSEILTDVKEKECDKIFKIVD